ncbi:MAG: GTPase ObgE [Chloroflexota bacterium]|nr:GTPase ObgE [Chloroflexota bacterium]
MFLDQTRIHVSGGDGGDGSASFRREAHVPRGGPDGGDGGRGGSVVLVAESGMTTLADFRRARQFRAKPGGAGRGQRAHGRNAADVELRVPPGTIVRSWPDAEYIGELIEPGTRLVVAPGGRGGRGNVHFASSTHRAPRHYQKGEPGIERWIELELKLLADIGLVGAPNAGKSTLLAALTAATPRVASYPFTTTTPNLGVVELPPERFAVIADVPGLIEGAHEGHGLGHAFLRHVERTRVLVGVVDGAATEPVQEWEAVAEELRLHDPLLLERPTRLVVTKLDLPAVRAAWPGIRHALRHSGREPVGISAHDGTGLQQLREELAAALAEAEAEPRAAAGERVLHRFEPLAEGWALEAEPNGLRIRGARIEMAARRTDFQNEESRDRFQRLLERLGVDAELRRQGAEAGTTVRIGPVELVWEEPE